MNNLPNYTKGYFKKDAGKKYDITISNKFELFIYQLEKRTLKKIIKKEFKGNKNIEHLDFACGTGRILKALNKLVKKQTGIDTSKEMLKEAQKIKNVNLIQGNILQEKVTKKKYDLITSFRLLLNLDDNYKVTILKKLKQYLKKDGILVINNHMNRYSLIGFQFFIRHLLGEKQKRKTNTNKGIINTMSELEMRKIIKKAGYKIIDVYRFTFFPGRKNIILLPKKTLFYLELIISKIPFLNLICKDQIYVCKKII